MDKVLPTSVKDIHRHYRRPVGVRNLPITSTKSPLAAGDRGRMNPANLNGSSRWEIDQKFFLIVKNRSRILIGP